MLPMMMYGIKYGIKFFLFKSFMISNSPNIEINSIPERQVTAIQRDNEPKNKYVVFLLSLNKK